jgi:DHA2 family multidrug resistance protein
MAFLGALLFFAGCWMMKDFTLDTSGFDIGVSLLLQGAGFALLYVPMTTVALVQVPRPKLADAAGMFALVRQVASSIGLALFGTLIARFGVQDRAVISNDLWATRPEVQQRLEGLRHLLVAHGYGPEGARHGALELLSGTIARQASVVTFERLFVVAGLSLLLAVPLIFLLKEPKKASPGPHVVEVE